MYKIIASEYPVGAVVEKDGKLLYSMGPRFLQHTRERDLRPIDEGDVRMFERDGFIRHEPPTEVQELVNWPAAAEAYEEEARKHAKVSA